MTALRDRIWPPFGRDEQESTGSIEFAEAGDSRIEQRKQELKDKEKSVTRRKVLTYGGGAAVLAGGGWGVYALLIDRRSPEETVRQYYVALDDGDVETAEGFIHTDSPVQEIPDIQVDLFEQNDITIQSTELLGKSDGRAQVRVTVTGAHSEKDQQETTQECRTEGREWKLWLAQ